MEFEAVDAPDEHSRLVDHIHIEWRGWLSRLLDEGLAQIGPKGNLNGMMNVLRGIITTAYP